MQERPSKQALLLAIARFLIEDARPALADPRLNFRALIAANLAGIVNAELATEDAHVSAELARLREVLPAYVPAPAPLPDLRRAQLVTANADVAAWLRKGDLSEEDFAKAARALRETLKDKLSVDNPRFDTSLDVE
jgi:AcrR family transcriptional regulator